MKEKKLLLLFALEAQGLMKGYKLKVPVADVPEKDKSFDVHAANECEAYKNAAYYRTMKK